MTVVAIVVPVWKRNEMIFIIILRAVKKNVIFQDEKKSDALQGLLASESDWQGIINYISLKLMMSPLLLLI